MRWFKSLRQVFRGIGIVGDRVLGSALGLGVAIGKAARKRSKSVDKKKSSFSRNADGTFKPKRLK